MPDSPVSHGVTVPLNPLLPEEDPERKCVWQSVVVAGNNSESANRAAMELEAKGYEFTRRAPDAHAHDTRMILVFRKMRDPARKTQVETLDTLEFQRKMLGMKLAVDQMTLQFHKFRADNPGPGWG